jgi:simple sugar transport system substrate-binding protein
VAGAAPSGVNRAELLRRAAVAAISPSAFLQPHPRWRFTFVNHATTNPFFIPARYGIGDACNVFKVFSTWTGSRKSDVGEMVSAMNRAIHMKVDGIAVSVIDPVLFDEPTKRALDAGIPVVAYNADGGRDNKRLAYVGQDLYQAGLQFGARIAELVHEGDVFLFIATPGQLNIQPRIDGARDALRDSGKPITAHVVGTGALVGDERTKVEQTFLAHRTLRGMFAVDAGSTQGVAEVMRRHALHTRGVRAGGFDLLPATLRAIDDGVLDFTIDQQPYLQGFLPIQQLFLYQYTGGLVSPAETNTGLKFVTRKNVTRYLTTHTRYEGSSKKERYPIS